MGQVKIQQQSVADTPASGYMNLYLDATSGLPAYKLASGVPVLVAGGGGLASRVGSLATASTTELQVVSIALPAGSMQVGTTYRLQASGQATVTTAGGTITFRLRLGTTTLAGNVVASIANTTVVGTAISFTIEALAIVQATGASGSVLGMLTQANSGTTGLTGTTQTVISPSGSAPVAVSVNTTAANLIEFTMQTSATTSTPTIYVASLEIVKP